MKTYAVQIKLFNKVGYIPSRAELFRVKASNLSVAAYRAVRTSLDATRRRGIQAFNMSIRQDPPERPEKRESDEKKEKN